MTTSEDTANTDTTELTKVELVIEEDEDSPYSSADYSSLITWNTTGAITLKLATLLTSGTRVYGYLLLYFSGSANAYRFPRLREIEKKIEFIVR